MQIAVDGTELGRLTDLCHGVVRRRLEQIRGVALVEVAGGLEHQVEVQINPEKFLTHGIAMDDISHLVTFRYMRGVGNMLYTQIKV